jgi:hypothetical protein
MTVCDLCDQEIPDDGCYEPGEIGSLTHGYGPGPVKPIAKLVRLIWPPAGRARRLSFEEKQLPENQYRIYEFHAQCIRDLIEDAIANRTA